MFSCDDIFATVAKLRANGVSFVPISRNYYDDLPTGFDLDERLVGRLRDLGILDDRSADGEYFHVYSESHPPLEKRTNFESRAAVNALEPARPCAPAH